MFIIIIKSLTTHIRHKFSCFITSVLCSSLPIMELFFIYLSGIFLINWYSNFSILNFLVTFMRNYWIIIKCTSSCSLITSRHIIIIKSNSSSLGMTCESTWFTFRILSSYRHSCSSISSLNSFISTCMILNLVCRSIYWCKYFIIRLFSSISSSSINCISRSI
nr:MAG TPA: hypothetical protein [Bacteriophage sp.]